MESKRFGNLSNYAKESAHKEYVYSRLPENIRQIGETNGRLKIYIEDYVMTYIRQIFTEKQEKAIVVFLGKKGKEQAAGCLFIYGAISVQCDMMEGTKELTADKWDQIYRDMHDNFPGAQMLGWGCGVSMWNSRADVVVKQIHRKYFSEDGKILFVTDVSEKDERLFLWRNGDLNEQSGFVVYYEKNPQMQDYMLSGQKTKSFEASYKDSVTANMRHVIEEKEEKRSIKTRQFTYGVCVAVFAVLLIGANMLYKSMDKIKSLEEALDSVQSYINSDKAAAVMSDAKQDTGNNIDISENDEFNGDTDNSVSDNGNDSKNRNEDDKYDEEGSGNTQADIKDRSSVDNSYTVNPSSTDKSFDELSPTDMPSNGSASQNSTSAAKRNDTKTKDNARKASTYSGKYESYIVNAGDTLSQIVWKQYHSFYYLDKVMKANNIKDSDKIYEGDCIILPDFSE